MLESAMKAMVYHKYGSPEALQLQEIEKPIIKDSDVLVRVHAASAKGHARGKVIITMPTANPLNTTFGG